MYETAIRYDHPLAAERLHEPAIIHAPLREVVSVHDVETNTCEYAPAFMAVNIENIAGIATVRYAARAEAEDLLADKRQRLFDGDFENIELDVDALGTAERVAEVKRIYGRHSEQYHQVWRGLVMDCSRKWGEAFRKNAWEFFDVTTQQHDIEANELYANGLSVDSMVRHGVTPVAEPEEADRRINDYVIQMTHKAAVQSELMASKAAVHVSVCPEWAIESYKTRPKAAHGGYAPGIKKLMVDYDWYDPKKGEVYHEQMGIPGLYIDDEVVNEMLVATGMTSGNVPLDKTQIHSTIGVVSRAECTGPEDVVRLLDELASAKHGVEVFLGELLPEGAVKDYGRVRIEAKERRKQQEKLSEELAHYVMSLQDSNVDHALATQMVEAYVQDKLLAVAQEDHEQAEIIFDKDTAARFRRAAELESMGRFDEAERERSVARVEAPDADSCGGGSCGLEKVDTASSEGKAIAKDLKAETGDKVVKDKERPCKNCGEMTVVYAYNATKVNKLCTNCGAFEHKKTSGGSKK